MKIEILDQAEDDLIEGFHFYEAQRPGLGSYFWSIFTKISILSVLMAESIGRLTKTITVFWPRRFPFAVFYKLVEGTVVIHAVVDCRRDPAWVRKRLK